MAQVIWRAFLEIYLVIKPPVTLRGHIGLVDLISRIKDKWVLGKLHIGNHHGNITSGYN